MIKFILGLFGFGNKVEKLLKKSGNALSTFTDTLHDLRDVQGAIVTHHKEQQAIIDKAAATQKTLIDQQLINVKLIGKIEEFLGHEITK